MVWSKPKSAKNFVSSYLPIFVLSFIHLSCVLGLTQNEYPIPVSESIEQTAQGQMTFLSYPKYYRDSENRLTKVETSLVASKDPDWDYEVTAGIWSLRVKTDGTFQARHEGDIFTYRFESLGVGRASKYEKFDLGEPN